MKLRTVSEIRAAACSRSLKERAREYFAAAEKFHALHARLRFPSERLDVVLEFHGVSKLQELKGDQRSLAEEVVAHDPGAVVRFGEHTIMAQIDRLGADGLVSEFAAGFRRELEKELDAVRDYLRPAYVATDTEDQIDAAPPLRALRMHLDRTGPCPPGSGPHAIASCFRGVLLRLTQRSDN